ncbi:MAG: hypothetical protein JWM77_3309 [Rhodospirillales bacterium]|nr:hypothetical protein [Rhodospirillales bacterium]
MFRSALALTVAASFAALPALAGDQDFTLTNRTGYTIEQVYVSKPTAKSWGRDILGEGLLENGRGKLVRFKPETESCKWEIKVVFDDKSEVEWEAFDLCSIHKITLKYNKQSGETSAIEE